MHIKVILINYIYSSNITFILLVFSKLSNFFKFLTQILKLGHARKIMIETQYSLNRYLKFMKIKYTYP